MTDDPDPRTPAQLWADTSERNPITGSTDTSFLQAIYDTLKEIRDQHGKLLTYIDDRLDNIEDAINNLQD